jgi:hypothetical protein
VEVRITFERGDAIRFAADGARHGADAVVALGGDGTVNEVVNGLSGFDVPLGIIPLGTANDFARQAGIPSDPDHAMDVILRRKPVRIDSAELNGRRFVNVSTAGIGAEATAETPADAKEALGALAYAITGVRKLVDLTPTRARVEAPELDIDVEFLVLAVGNARVTGGGTVLTARVALSSRRPSRRRRRAVPAGSLASRHAAAIDDGQRRWRASRRKDARVPRTSGRSARARAPNTGHGNTTPAVRFTAGVARCEVSTTYRDLRFELPLQNVFTWRSTTGTNCCK